MKYRIVKYNEEGELRYYKIQYKFLFWWIDYHRNYEYVTMFSYLPEAQRIIAKLRNNKLEKIEILNY